MSNHGLPRCLLVVGDGFSRSFLTHAGLDSVIITDPLIPAPSHIHYSPYDSHDKYAAQPLWSREMFSNLWDGWQILRRDIADDSLCFRTMCEVLAQLEEEAANLIGSNDSGGFTVILDSPEYQLRAYLFELFRSYDNLIRSQDTSLIMRTWSWHAVLCEAIKWFSVSVLSFNYDYIVEHLLASIGYGVYLPPIAWYPSVAVDAAKAVCVAKPHGSISYRCGVGFGIGPDKWQSGAIFHNVTSVPYLLPEYPPSQFPTVPDLVPPGFAGSRAHFPDDSLRRYILHMIAESDIVVWCGLSGRAPDEVEIASYLSAIKEDAKFAHVGLHGDDSNFIATSVRSRLLNYRFYDGSSNEQLLSMVADIA